MLLIIIESFNDNEIKFVFRFFEIYLLIEQGEKVGKFVGVIEKDAWAKNTNYLFKPETDTVGCVQIDEFVDPTRAKLIWDAYKSNSIVRIRVTGNHLLTGIAMANRS